MSDELKELLSERRKKLEQYYIDLFEGRVLLPAKDAAKVLGTTEGNLALMRTKRKGPDYVKLGRSVRYDLFHLLDLVEQSKVAV